MVVTLTHRGFIKRISSSEFRSQNRGGVGISASNLRDDDFIEHVVIASTHDYLLIFSNKGLVYQIKVHEIPQLSRSARGENIKGLIGISANEEISTILSVKDFKNESMNVFFATRRGLVKRVSLSEFENIKQTGKKAIILDENDDLIDVKSIDGIPTVLSIPKIFEKIKFEENFLNLIENEDDREFIKKHYSIQPETDRYIFNEENLSEEDETKIIDILKNLKYGKDIILATRKGKALRFNEENVRVMGRATRGVTGIRLEEGDEVCGLLVLKDDTLMLLVTEYGYGKRIDPALFTPHGRATGGQRYYKYSDERGEVVSVKQVKETDDIVAITSKGQIIKVPTDEITQQGRNTTGIKVVKITKPDFVVSIARSPKSNLK